MININVHSLLSELAETCDWVNIQSQLLNNYLIKFHQYNSLGNLHINTECLKKAFVFRFNLEYFTICHWCIS